MSIDIWFDGAFVVAGVLCYAAGICRNYTRRLACGVETFGPDVRGVMTLEAKGTR